MSDTKPKTIQAVLSVARKEYITPHYIRVYLTGDDVQRFANTTVGVNNKILVPPEGVNEIFFPTFDYEKKEWNHPEPQVRPFVRTYTHRGIDTQRNELWIDFVAHGDEGPASAWALKAAEGDRLGVLMKDGKSELYAPAQSYLLVGDATALPVLSAILEDLPETATGTCIIEVPEEADIQQLHTRAGITFKWLTNAHPEKGSRLANAVKELKLPETDRFAYVAAEFSSVKEIRNYLRKEKGWNREELYAYSYWKAGVAEDKSTADRQHEKNALDS